MYTEEIIACSCGVTKDDGGSMIACDHCNIWSHVKCSGILDDIPQHFICAKCLDKMPVDEWSFRCECGITQKNYDDGWRMIACEACKMWQHTACIGMQPHEEPKEDYHCPHCIREMEYSNQETKTNDDWSIDDDVPLSWRFLGRI